MSKKPEHIHEGNLTIRTAADAEKYRNITKVTGYLSINSNAKLDAPALTSVGGYLSINSNAKLDAPALTSVGGGLYISSSAKLDAPALTSVGGGLYIYSNVKLDALTSVGGDLYIYSNAKLDALTSVGGYLSINSNAKLDAPALTSVGGKLSIYSSAKLTAGKLYCGGYEKFKVIDDIGCVVLSEKKQGDMTILMCRHSKIKNQKVVGDKFYVAQKGEDNAHGKTIAEATQELLFKIGPRDVERFRNMPMHTAKTPSEWALIYRMVTGACQYGTAQFIETRHDLKKEYTLAEILTLTEGQFGHDRFSETVNAAVAA
jgi:prefoldin subunit 5